jgi:hypothetical protein
MVGNGITKINNFIWHILNMLITVVFCSTGTRALCLGTNWLGHDSHHSPPPGAEVKNECHCTYPPLTCFHYMHSDNITDITVLNKMHYKVFCIKEITYCIFMWQIHASTDIAKLVITSRCPVVAQWFRIKHLKRLTHWDYSHNIAAASCILLSNGQCCVRTWFNVLLSSLFCFVNCM